MTCETCEDECSGSEVLWRVKQGALFLHRLKIVRGNGSSFNLTGYAVRCQFRRNKFESTTLAVANATCTITDAAKGIVEIKLGASTTTNMSDGGVFDVEVYDPDDADVVYRVYEGRWTTSLEATLASP